jgi:superfamily II DNA/RNA helicase
MGTFDTFDLLPTIQATLTEKKLLVPTPIQERALPLLLNGRSMVGISQTGSGKTLAYALPILHRLKSLENSGNAVVEESSPRALIVVPTRELGEQVSKVFKPFTHTTRLRVRTVLGGTTLEVARRNIAGKFEVLVATPGRLVKLLGLRLIDLSAVRTLVFDEADQMLDQGFLPDANRIVNACPPSRQMALFSATVSRNVQELIEKLFSDAEVIREEGSHRVVATLKTLNADVRDGKRLPVLTELLETPVEGGTMIFVNTRDQCDKLAAELVKLGKSHAIYRGEMEKADRRRNLTAFRDGKVELLISTDLASRGLDVDHVGRVINYHMPQQMENYLHRVGRTARAGRAGLVVNFVTERDEPLISKLTRNQTRAEVDQPTAPALKKRPAPAKIIAPVLPGKAPIAKKKPKR